MIARILKAMLDGKEVQWSEEVAKSPDLATDLEALRVIHAIAGINRSSGAAETDPPGPHPATPATRSTSPETRMWGNLELLDKIGEGSFGEVYRAFDPVLEIEVALKVWSRSTEAQARHYLSEARRLARVRHPNVLLVHGAGVHEGQAGMWTELLIGRDLERLLAEQGVLSPHEAATIGVDLCRALAALHRAGLIHRDVKANNVMREQGGRIVLLDFGTAIEALDPAHVSPAAAAGTLITMAPEQLHGGVLSPATDFYALGVLLYRLVTAGYPIEASDVEELYRKHGQHQAVPLRDRRPALPTEFIEVVERALAPAPEDRFESAGAMERALLASIQSAPTTVWTSDSPPVIRRTVYRLPRHTTRFVGREDEIVECLQWLEQNSLLTLTGPGGSGKTRLGIRLIEELAERDWDQVGFVDLAALADGSRLPGAVAVALDLAEQPQQDLMDVVESHLATRRVLLAFDNCEHLLPDCARLVERLLRNCLEVKIIATSRERLGVPGEQVHMLRPLTYPGPQENHGLSLMSRFESVRLLIQRGMQAEPGFRLTEQNASSVAEITRRLEGIPLAIELAAARLRVLSIHQILARLKDRFRLLANDRAPVARHETLWATFEWSYEHLDEPDQSLYRTLAVFSGGSELGAIAALWGSDGDEYRALDELSRLADKSLIIVDRSHEESVRYRMLETVREHALEKLRGAGELDAVRRRHVQYFAHLAEDAEPGLWGKGQTQWVERIERDHENLLAALTWCEEASDIETAMRLEAVLARFWYIRGRYSLGRSTLARMLSRPEVEHHGILHSKVAYGAAVLALWQADYPAAEGLYQSALVGFRRAGEPLWAARCLTGLGIAAHGRGDAEARLACYQEGLAIYRQIGDARGIAATLSNIAVVAWTNGDLESARTMTEEALGFVRESGDRDAMVGMLVNLGEITTRLKCYLAARNALAEALRVGQEIGAQRVTAYALEGSAKLAIALGAHERAARLYGSATGIRASTGTRRLPDEHEEIETIMSEARQAMGEQAFTAAREAGRVLSLEAAVADALGSLALDTQ